MKKVEIVTLHYIRNYGSVLQTYATQKKFEQMGYSTEVVDYVRPNAEPKALLQSGLASKHYKNPIKKAVYVVLKTLENKFRDRVCVDFLEKYVHMTRRYKDYADLKSDPPMADIYVTGSDQTWNSEYNGGVLPAYYLDFAPEDKKRIGYSVSIGLNEIPQNEVEQTKDYVQKYTAISVREASAKKILDELGGQNVEHVLDPTLVLNGDDWSKLAAPRCVQGDYILIYKLNNNDEMERYAEQLAKETGCKIIRMTYFLSNLRSGGKIFFCPKVEEFLSLIKYATYVITDSFHCTAFSLNFKRNFYIFYPGKYSTRLQSVLSLTGTEHRVITENTQKPAEIDFDFVDKKLNEEREKVTRFIENYC